MLRAGQKVNPEEAILVNAADSVVLYSKYPEICLTKDQMLSLPVGTPGTNMARAILYLFFRKEELGKVNRQMLEEQHPALMESIYGNFKHILRSGKSCQATIVGLDLNIRFV